MLLYFLLHYCIIIVIFDHYRSEGEALRLQLLADQKIQKRLQSMLGKLCETSIDSSKDSIEMITTAGKDWLELFHSQDQSEDDGGEEEDVLDRRSTQEHTFSKSHRSQNRG